VSKKKVGEGLRCLTLKKISPFFFDGVAAKKNQKTALKKFRLCGGDQGLCPWSPPPFEKGGRKLFESGGVQG
jgi:hypothetical protein